MNLNDQNIFGARLKLARKMAGLSLQDLADALINKVSKQALSKYEQGAMQPSNDVLLALSKALQVKPDYFFKQKSVELGTVLFRKKASLSKKDEEAIVEKVRDYTERYQELEELLNVQLVFSNPLEGYEIRAKADVERAAEKLRLHWGIGTNPILNLVDMLELNGIKVILIDEADGIDGLAVYSSSGIPIVVVNRQGKSIERIRFTIVHELAHLILDLSVLGDNEKLIEEWCHFFSTCFIVPTSMLVRLVGNGKRTYIHINELIRIKELYGISLRALVHRLREIGIITDNYYQRWVIYMSKTYGQKDEPGNYKGEERTRRFDQLLTRALSEGIISVSKAAALSNKDIDHIRKHMGGAFGQ